MSSHPSLVSLAALVTSGMALVGQALLVSPALAGEQWETSISTEPDNLPPPPPSIPGVTVLPGSTINIPVGPYVLDEKDEIAALERIQYALTEVGDGKTYVWRRWHGKLSGLIQPTASFKAADGKVCRHLVVMMTTGRNTKKQEGIACRLPSGRWQLEG